MHLDDFEIARLEGDAAGAERATRLRFENQWSDTWTSGPTDPPIPAHWNRPKKRPDTLSQKLHNRAEVRKLYAQLRSGPKAQRDAARHLLQTRYKQSVS